MVRKRYAETITCTPPRALTPNPHQQRDRAPQPRVQEMREDDRDLPRQKKRNRAGDHQAQVRHRERVGVAPLPGRVAAGRVAIPDGGPPTCQEVRKKLDNNDD